MLGLFRYGEILYNFAIMSEVYRWNLWAMWGGFIVLFLLYTYTLLRAWQFVRFIRRHRRLGMKNKRVKRK